MSSSLDELRCRWSSPGQWAQFSNRDTVPGDGHGLSARNGIEYLSAAIAKIPHTDGCHEGSVSPVRHSQCPPWTCLRSTGAQLKRSQPSRSVSAWNNGSAPSESIAKSTDDRVSFAGWFGHAGAAH